MPNHRDIRQSLQGCRDQLHEVRAFIRITARMCANENPADHPMFDDLACVLALTEARLDETLESLQAVVTRLSGKRPATATYGGN